MIGYLLDTSALWHLFRTPGETKRWESHLAAGTFHICEPTRTEFLYSARSPAHRDQLSDRLDTLFRPLSVPKSAWRWVDTAQYKLTQHGQHRSAGVIDLLVCATAVHHGHAVLHVDNDFATVAKIVPEVEQRDARN